MLITLPMSAYISHLRFRQYDSKLLETLRQYVHVLQDVFGKAAVSTAREVIFSEHLALGEHVNKNIPIREFFFYTPNALVQIEVTLDPVRC